MVNSKFPTVNSRGGGKSDGSRLAFAVKALCRFSFHVEKVFVRLDAPGLAVWSARSAGTSESRSASIKRTLRTCPTRSSPPSAPPGAGTRGTRHRRADSPRARPTPTSPPVRAGWASCSSSWSPRSCRHVRCSRPRSAGAPRSTAIADARSRSARPLPTSSTSRWSGWPPTAGTSPVAASRRPFRSSHS